MHRPSVHCRVGRARPAAAPDPAPLTNHTAVCERVQGAALRGFYGRPFTASGSPAWLTATPTRQFRDRLVQMCANQGLWVVAVDPAYTSRWGREYWLKPMQERTRTTISVHHAAAVVIGRRAIGHRARRRPHVTGGDRRIANAESRGSGPAWTGRVQGPDRPNADSAARKRRIRQISAKGTDQGLGRPGPFGAARRTLDSRAR